MATASLLPLHKQNFMRINQPLIAILISGGTLIASCGTPEQKANEEGTETAPISPTTDTAAVAQYNKDEAEMLDKHETATYKSADGQSAVKISFIEKENGNKFLRFQKDGGETIELSLVTAHEGPEVYANADKKIQWESKESGSLGTLTENGKTTEYTITNE